MAGLHGIPSISRIEIDTAAAKVYAALRHLLISGEIGPGSRLIETELAEQFGVSRAPVREALRQLEDEGLVTSAPNRGKMVVRLTKKELRNSYAVRAVLEGLAAKLAVENPSQHLSEQLRSILARMKAAAENGDASLMNDLDADFHRTIWEMSSNSVLSEALNRLLARIRIYIPITIKADGLLANWTDHGEILAALDAKDAVSAEDRMRHHVEAAAARLVRHAEEALVDEEG